MSSVDPNMVRALVRQALEQRLGLGPTHLSVHPSQLAIGEGPALSAISECYEDMDLPLQNPCLIEPHRPCCNSGYCKKLGH